MVNPKFRLVKRKFQDFAQDFKSFLKKYERTTKIRLKANNVERSINIKKVKKRKAGVK